MILDVTELRRLDDAMTAAHRLPQACGHPKSDLRICSDCGTVLCDTCDAARPDRGEYRHALKCGWSKEDEPWGESEP